MKTCSYGGVSYPFPGTKCPSGEEEKSYLKDLGRIYQEIKQWAVDYDRDYPCDYDGSSVGNNKGRFAFFNKLKKSAYAQAIKNPGTKKACGQYWRKYQGNWQRRSWYAVTTGGTKDLTVDGQRITIFSNDNWEVYRGGSRRRSGVWAHNIFKKSRFTHKKKWYEQ